MSGLQRHAELGFDRVAESRPASFGAGLWRVAAATKQLEIIRQGEEHIRRSMSAGGESVELHRLLEAQQRLVRTVGDLVAEDGYLA